MTVYSITDTKKGRKGIAPMGTYFHTTQHDLSIGAIFNDLSLERPVT